MDPRDLIEAVTVCVYHSTKLKYCITNRKLLDRWLIVTVPDDYETILLCQKFLIEYCFTTRVFSDGASFAKGRAINDGLAHLAKSGWLLQLDCDIVLPSNIRKLIKEIPLSHKNVSSLFGLKARRALGVHSWYLSTRKFSIYYRFHNLCRKMLTNSDEILDMEKSAFARLQKSNGLSEMPGSLRTQWKNFITNRWDKLIYPFEGGEFMHLGYFQLFHSEKFRVYPEKSKNPNEDDVRFREQFPATKRQILDAECVHLGLVCDGRHYFRHLDDYVCNTKQFKSYRYLNTLNKILRKNKSKISISRNLDHLYRPNTQRFFIPLPQPKSKMIGWNTYGIEKKYCKKKVQKVNGFTTEVFEFNPAESGHDWFTFSITSAAEFDNTKHQNLYFNIKTINLNSGLEVGYGNSKKMDWTIIKSKALKNRTWHKCKLSFSKANKITKLQTLIIFRNHEPYSRGRILISGVFYQ